jgi:outer membrane protein
MKKIKAFVVAMLLLYALPALAEVKIGYVDVQRAVMSVEEGKSVKKKLETFAKKKKEELEKAQDDLKTRKEELEKQASLMPDDLKRKKVTEFQQKVAEFQEAYLKSEKELATKQAELSKPILEKLEKIINALAKEQNYDVIVEKSAVLFAKNNFDLTDEIIGRYNSAK